VLATASAHADAYEYVALASAVVLAVYWLAHVYVTTHTGAPGGPKRLPADRQSGRSRIDRLWVELRRSRFILWATCTDSSLRWLPKAAVYFSVVPLASMGDLSAHRAGSAREAALIDLTVAGSVGLVVVAKALLHS